VSPKPSRSQAAVPDYPPAPWPLVGQLFCSTWLVPAAKCQVSLGPGLEPRVIAGRVVVAAAFVEYQEGSALTYYEAFAGVLARKQGARFFGMTVPFMWVDSAASMRAGRELWALPKEMARFEFKYASDGLSATATDERGRPLMEATYRKRVGVPGRAPLPLPVLQPHQGRYLETNALFKSKVNLVSARVTVPAESPLAALGIADQEPFTSIWMQDFNCLLDAGKPVD